MHALYSDLDHGLVQKITYLERPWGMIFPTPQLHVGDLPQNIEKVVAKPVLSTAHQTRAYVHAYTCTYTV